VTRAEPLRVRFSERRIARQLFVWQRRVSAENSPSVVKIVGLLAVNTLKVLDELSDIHIFRQEFEVLLIQKPRRTAENHNAVVKEFFEITVSFAVRVEPYFVGERDPSRRNMHIYYPVALFDDPAAGEREIVETEFGFFVLKSAEGEAGAVKKSAVPAENERADRSSAFNAFVDFAAYIVHRFVKDAVGQAFFAESLVNTGQAVYHEHEMQPVFVYAVFFCDVCKHTLRFLDADLFFDGVQIENAVEVRAESFIGVEQSGKRPYPVGDGLRVSASEQIFDFFVPVHFKASFTDRTPCGIDKALLYTVF
jgi:hypothetical protein